MVLRVLNDVEENAVACAIGVRALLVAGEYGCADVDFGAGRLMGIENACDCEGEDWLRGMSYEEDWRRVSCLVAQSRSCSSLSCWLLSLRSSVVLGWVGYCWMRTFRAI